MKATFRRSIRVPGLAALAGALLLTGACSTSTLEPQAPPQAIEAPDYVGLPHPGGYGIEDVRALMADRDAPSAEVIHDCDQDYRQLVAKTNSRDELAEGMRELVRRHPSDYHWCFYGKILELDDALKTHDYYDERQKLVLDAYGFLVPLARAFLTEFRDTRYLRWAVHDYSRISEWVFFRKLELSPEESSELVDAGSAFGESPNRAESQKEDGKPVDVLDKYGIAASALPAAAPSPSAERYPASDPQAGPQSKQFDLPLPLPSPLAP